MIKKYIKDFEKHINKWVKEELNALNWFFVNSKNNIYVFLEFNKGKKTISLTFVSFL